MKALEKGGDLVTYKSKSNVIQYNEILCIWHSLMDIDLIEPRKQFMCALLLLASIFLVIVVVNLIV